MQERARPMIDHTKLAEFRQSLPESDRYEVHRFFVARWDIVKARYLTQQPGRRLDTLNVLTAAKAYKFDQPQTIDSWAYVDPKLAMSDAIDPDIPVILALIAREQEGEPPIPLLIDGLHRLYKAYREERITIPCFALTPEEEQLCRL
jgi:hypothetical protein